MKEQRKAVARYLIELASDPVKLEAFKSNPDIALDSTSLSASDKEVLRSRDAGRINAALLDGVMGADTTVVVLTDVELLIAVADGIHPDLSSMEEPVEEAA